MLRLITTCESTWELTYSERNTAPSHIGLTPTSHAVYVIALALDIDQMWPLHMEEANLQRSLGREAWSYLGKNTFLRLQVSYPSFQLDFADPGRPMLLHLDLELDLKELREQKGRKSRSAMVFSSKKLDSLSVTTVARVSLRKSWEHNPFITKCLSTLHTRCLASSTARTWHWLFGS